MKPRGWKIENEFKSERIMDVKKENKTVSIKMTVWYKDGLLHAIPYEWVNGEWVKHVEKVWISK